MKKKIQKILSVILIINLLLFHVSPLALAEETSSEPQANVEETTSAPTPTQEEEQPTEQQDYIEPDTTTETPEETVVTPTAIPTPTRIPEEGEVGRTQSASSALTVGVNPTPSIPPSQSNTVGDAEVESGDATSTANVSNAGNSNVSESGPSATVSGGEGASVVGSGNGSDSNNNGSATIANNDTTNQENSAIVNTLLNQLSSTGLNNASGNVGNSSIDTGDANTTGTVITAVNTNVDGIMVSEFNIADDHVGDIFLDFAANCISGCVGGSLKTANTGNGSDSDNTASIDQTNNSDTFQYNDATIGSELNLTADSGNNIASKNTGGDSSISTGDANVEANVLTFVNNNIAGSVVYAVVNIFGDLIGDILFPEEFMASCCIGSNILASNIGNGSDSTNNANIQTTDTDETFQTNDANLTNDLIFNAQTGNNDSSRNTGGDSSISTGDTSVDANVLNIANSNIIGSNMWLVLVNEAGNWIGKILGAPEGTNYAGSSGTEFNVDENGYITASNNGNGSGSTNNANVSETNTDSTTQTNTANVENKLNLSANTGGNKTNDNTGGNSQITTGDANIVANLVNFVNNNIKGNGKLFVSVVNVFGSWIGDFVSPGQKKEENSQNSAHAQNTGGPSNGGSTTSVQNSTQSVTTTTDGENTVVQDTQPTQNYPGYSIPYSYEETSDLINPQALGVSINKGSVLSDSATSNKQRVNLAWLVVLLPLFALGFGVKRIVLPRILKKI